MISITKIIVIFALIWCVCSIQPCQTQSDDQNNEVFLGLNQKSGFIELDANSSMFYWLFKSETENTKKPLIIFLAGGPGCSSELSVFGGNGPYRVNQNLTLEKNEDSWIKVANVLFVDQPIGTGYSFTTVFDSTEKQYSSQFYQFFVGFLEQFPEFNKRPLYIAGVSYGGHFVPDIAYYMFQQNNSQINLIGLSIGDGWVNPYIQYASYPVYAFQNDLINQSTFTQYQQQVKLCQSLIKNGKFEQSYNYCTQIESNILGNPQLFNEYNIKMPVSAYSFDSTQEFLQQPSIIQNLHVENINWTECSGPVYNSLNFDFQLDVSNKIGFLLNNGIKVVTYNGEYDFICNWIGGLQWIKVMKWDYTTEFNQQNLDDWKQGNQILGKIQQYGNLTFLKINNAGHMVPTDQPKVSLYQISQFINN